MFHPMALTVIFALIAAFILSLTFVPAMVALCITRQGHREGHVPDPLGQGRLRAGGPLGGEDSATRWSAAVPRSPGSLAALHAARAGVRAHARREGHRDARDAHPSTGITQSQAMQYDVEKTVSGSSPRSRSPTPRPARRRWRPTRCRPTSPTRSSSSSPREWRSEAELDRLIAEKTEEMEKMGAHGDARGGRGTATGKRPKVPAAKATRASSSSCSS
jgi:hypothetical protein